MKFTTFAAIIFAVVPAFAADFKMNEFHDSNCQQTSYKHQRVSIFCGDIDGTTHSVYVNPSFKSKAVFWSGSGCGGYILRTIPVSKSGQCVPVNSNEHSMGFA